MEDLLLILKIDEELTGPRKKQRQFTSTSLRKLAMNSITKEVYHFMQLGFSSSSKQINPFIILPETLKNELLKEFLSHDIIKNELASLWAIQCLITPSTTEFKFPFIIFNHSRYNDLWNLLILNCNNLQKIKWQHHGEQESTAQKACVFASLVQLKNLQEISMPGIVCDDMDLCKLAANLPKLRCLDVGLADRVSEIGFCALSKLDNFQELLFRCDSNHEKRYLLYYLCMKYLPKLYYIEQKSKIPFFHCYFCTTNAIENIQNSEAEERMIGLKTLHLRGWSNPPGFLRLPNLETLFLLEPSNDFYPDERMSNVTTLSLSFANMNTSAAILSQIGNQLSELSIGVVGTLTLDVIFKECPNLEKLFIEQEQQNISLSPHCNDGYKETLKHLQIAHRDFGANNFFTSNLQPGLLTHLLRFPNLRKITLSCNLSQAEADKIMKTLQEKAIMQLVESFSIIAPTESDVGVAMRDRLVELNERVRSILLCVATHCPNAIDVH